MKAQPHRSSNYYETVCCAGIGRDGKWRRQYPVPFRILHQGQKFKRWQWIRYRFTPSKRDLRVESQKVTPESIETIGEIKKTERARFLNPLVRATLEEATANNESLAIVRPSEFELYWKKKSDERIETERAKHAALASQLSLLDNSAMPFEPCPFEFRVRWTDQAGAKRNHICDDWETAQAFKRFRGEYGEAQALELIKQKYDDYFERGLVFAFSTHSRRNVTYGTRNQWLLVGMIRLDFDAQAVLFT